MIQIPYAGSSAYHHARMRAPHLVSLAVEPTGEGSYADAIREWIEQIHPIASGLPLLRLVR